MRRCGEKEFHDSFLKRFGVLYDSIFGGIIFHMRIAQGKNRKDHLHLYDPWGLRIVRGFESGLVGLEVVVSCYLECCRRSWPVQQYVVVQGLPTQEQSIDVLDSCSVHSHF